MKAEFLALVFFCQAKLRLEMEMERLRQTHSKEIESKDDEVEDIRQSCSKKVKGVITELVMRTNTFSSFVSQVRLLSGYWWSKPQYSVS